ncbi:ArsI/CadI family heavy metal resistance metalloenzyme [Rhodopila sp.]|uniref:ArsI/CadI family heavy metal resistance metalloenzyme n=1 Tax=Rhodopila sp. TaxID=2480087 RepID=UPI003D0F1E6F
MAALAQGTRLDIFRLLMQAGTEGMPAGQIGERLGLPSATLAFHLKELKNAGLATFERNGRSLIYSAVYPAMNALLGYLTENCCQGRCRRLRHRRRRRRHPGQRQGRNPPMKRMHIHVGVNDIEESVRFYSALFGTEPAKLKSDYAKWMLDDPHVNFAISTRARTKGVDHMGIQVDNADELVALREQMSAANISTHSDGETTCCYAKSEKSWVEDPSGIAWEAYHSMEDAQIFSAEDAVSEPACCTPETLQGVCRAPKPELAAEAPCCGPRQEAAE